MRALALRTALRLLYYMRPQKAFDLSMLVLASAKERGGAQYLLDNVVPNGLREEVWKAYAEA